jgi:hypothetical protein
MNKVEVIKKNIQQIKILTVAISILILINFGFGIYLLIIGNKSYYINYIISVCATIWIILENKNIKKIKYNLENNKELKNE